MYLMERLMKYGTIRYNLHNLSAYYTFSIYTLHLSIFVSLSFLIYLSLLRQDQKDVVCMQLYLTPFSSQTNLSCMSCHSLTTP